MSALSRQRIPTSIGPGDAVGRVVGIFVSVSAAKQFGTAIVAIAEVARDEQEPVFAIILSCRADCHRCGIRVPCACEIR